MADVVALLAWYDRHRRTLPWRARPGEAADPYRVWLSEVMLQQTTVAAVIPYYEQFLTCFPTVGALAAADAPDVMRRWAGLGYYARARNLLACAREVVRQGGEFPHTVEALRRLPGIGAYTAQAIASIAFGVPGVPVDGNVERVVARVFAIETPLPAARAALSLAAATLGGADAAVARPSDFAQALFDLGATICTPAAPACVLCPWQHACLGRRGGDPAALPRRVPRRARPVRHGAHFWLSDAAGGVLLRQRPERGLLGGMTELPGTPWREPAWSEAELLAHAPQPAGWRRLGEVRHVFTHFELRLQVFGADVARIEAEGMVRPVAGLGAEALPTVMRKCAALAVTGGSPLIPALSPERGRGGDLLPRPRSGESARARGAPGAASG